MKINAQMIQEEWQMVLLLFYVIINSNLAIFGVELNDM